MMDRRSPKVSKGPACVNCSQTFAIRDPAFPFGPRAPLLLHCGHSICENCLKTFVRNKNIQVVCRVCSGVSDLKNTSEIADTLHSQFPLNLYLVGKVQVRSVMKDEDSMISFKKNKQKRNNSVMDLPKKDMCCECSRITADTRCQQCDVIYCNLCFNKVHRAARSLQMHKREPLSEVSKTSTEAIEICQHHEDQKLEFYCNQCDTIVCAYCVISDHMNHGAISMKEKNASLHEELSKSLEEATEVLRQLKFTQEKTVASSRKAEASVKPVVTEQRIVSHFSFLHGYLQRLEAKLLLKLKEAQNRAANSLQNILTELEISIKETEEAIAEGKAAYEQNVMGSINVCSMVEKLRKLKNIPCHLYFSEPRNKQEGYKFSANEHITKVLDEHCQITVPDNVAYVLKTAEELPENYQIEKLPAISFPKTAKKTCIIPAGCVPDRRIRSDSHSSDVSGSSKASSTVCKNKGTDMQELREGSVEQVVVSHFMSPSEFYVYRKGNAADLNDLTSQFTIYVTVRENVPTNIEIGNIYLVKYKMDNNWYRARVTAAVDDEQFEVFYIDYGNKENTTAENMRSIPERFLKIPPLALRCSLFGCVPVGGTWSMEAINIMVNVTSGVEVTMIVVNCVSPTHFEVDLSRPECGVLSIRDAMVFLELATLSGTCKYHVPKVKKKDFFTDVDLKKGGNFNARVSAVTSPHDFYVQKITDSDSFFINMVQKMNEVYKVGGSARNDLIYTPKVGMAVAALSSEDNKWYRGRVIKLPGKRNVEVFFVDTGRKEVLFWTDMRTLHDEFFRLSKQAIHCSLCDVVPITGTEWAAEACEEFKSVLSQSHSVVSVVFVEAVDNGKSSVILYQGNREVDVCINALLIKNGQAKSSGANVGAVEFNDATKANSKSCVATPASKTNTSTKPMKKAHARRTSEEVNRIKRTRKAERVQRVSTSSSQSDDESSSLQTDNDTEEVFRLPVKVLSITSPGRFFITIPSLEKQIKRLTEDMNNFYSRSESSNVTWRKDAKCAVFRYSDMNWYRGIVLEVISDKKIKVMLKDIATEEVVNWEVVQILDSKFCDVRDGAILCHLSKIKAPGGGEKWPAITCEIFTSEVAKYQKLYITKTGDVDSGSLPVELWVKHAKVSGPLDPIIEEWRTINITLVNQGLALPDKSSDFEQPTTSTADFSKQLSETKSASVEKDIVSWLEKSSQNAVCPPSTGDANKFLTAIDRSAVTPPSPSHGEDDDKQSFKSSVLSVASTSTRLRSGAEMNSITEWLPAVPFKDLQFEAHATYVDEECTIYLQDPRQNKPTLDVLETALTSRYSNSKPSPSDMYWFPGQLCIVQFHLNLKWYRGKVISVNCKDNTVKVYFVDYGNVEICKASELRKNICMGHIPIQCHKCKTHGIVPISDDGKWPTATLDFIHMTVVDKRCFVELKEQASADSAYAVVSLKCQGGLDLLEILLSMHYAIYEIDYVGQHSAKCDSEVDDHEDEDVIIVKQTCVPALAWCRVTQMVSNKMDISFVPMKIPDDINELVVDVTALISPTEFVVNLATTNWVNLATHPILRELHNKYDNMVATIQEEAPKLPVLSKPYVGKACCAKYSADEKWYRAVVISEQKDQLQVQYVDYGNVEALPLEEVRQIKDEWVSGIPSQGIFCVLSDITEVRPFSNEEQKKLTESMLESSLNMKIKSRSASCLYVAFYNSDGNLAYQSLLDANLLSYSRGTSD